ncbi:MAG: hypothetical protein COA78_01110 [Blastopirellula sp.]|nr:MAG: hypothetical protein COA78_01110 [Blastopirellula sp.]
MSDQELQEPPKWRALNYKQRRVIGVLIEKAKTTPDAYPMTVNALTNGCNQKSNRSPQMTLDSFEVEEVLEQLREIGAVAEVHGDGRVIKYRHYMKDWLACEGNELAIMAELLLRGEQTLGELRSRAARMGKIPDIGSLRPLVEDLQRKKLVVALTAPGRGQIVTHGLYEPREHDRLLEKHGRTSAEPVPERSAAPVNSPTSHTESAAPIQSAETITASETPLIKELQQEMQELRGEVGRLKKEIEDIWSSLG